jgi:hypothetical protein
MSDHFWLRRAHLPTKCPECGTKKRTLPQTATINDYFKDHYFGLHYDYLFDEKWRMKRWRLRCMNCVCTRELLRTDTIIRRQHERPKDN